MIPKTSPFAVCAHCHTEIRPHRHGVRGWVHILGGSQCRIYAEPTTKEHHDPRAAGADPR